MWGLESLLLHRVVREEANEQLVATGCDGWGLLGAAEATQTCSFVIFAIVQLNVVVGAFQVGLDVDLIEGLRRHVCDEEERMRLGVFKSKYNNQLAPSWIYVERYWFDCVMGEKNPYLSYSLSANSPPSPFYKCPTLSALHCRLYSYIFQFTVITNFMWDWKVTHLTKYGR